MPEGLDWRDDGMYLQTGHGVSHGATAEYVINAMKQLLGDRGDRSAKGDGTETSG